MVLNNAPLGVRVAFLRIEVSTSLFNNLSQDDISCAIMGESGVDIKLSPKARKLIPYSIECKNKETDEIIKLNYWEMWKVKPLEQTTKV